MVSIRAERNHPELPCATRLLRRSNCFFGIDRLVRRLEATIVVQRFCPHRIEIVALFLKAFFLAQLTTISLGIQYSGEWLINTIGFGISARSEERRVGKEC